MDAKKIAQYISSQKKAKNFDTATVFQVLASEIKEITSDLRDNKHLQLKLITATDEREENGCFKLWYIFAAPTEHVFIVPYIELKNTEEFPSLMSSIEEAGNYERKIQTFFGLTPIGHFDNRPLILHENWPSDLYPLRKDFNWNTKPEESQGTYPFQKVDGEGIYEIPVGPIHAGIIEPGHFRFSVVGEEIMLLEARLGFVHKGVEKIFETVSPHEMIKLSEKISGDSSYSHSLAFSNALEQLSDTVVPKRADHLRVIYAELERLANHFGDIGAIMLDTGFSFGGSHGARLREIIIRMEERLTGSRFLRGVNICGGVTKDISSEEKNNLITDFAIITKDFSELIEIAQDSASLLNRLKGTGVLPYTIAQKQGATGVAAKAVGIAHDARVDFPYAAYGALHFDTVETEQSGDVYARFCVRIKEVYASINLITKALTALPSGPICANTKPIFKKNAIAITLVEGWRGDILYFVTTDSKGKISRVAPRDPSWVNWPLLEQSAPGNIVPDFPLINKSFNLSYTGNDL
ncbi:MAG: NADH-quinone oxidoreductase subunit C [Candidatus Magasanikbacteria bacterium]|nr:NADH-quinone oxidoreductase subunit C [Candidatus Magasanikbacteria bacterium]